MRAVCLALVLLAGCRSVSPPDAELSREECGALVRHVQKLQSDDTGGLQEALHVGRRADIDRCLHDGTRSAYRCVMQAGSRDQLEPCDSLFK